MFVKVSSSVKWKRQYLGKEVGHKAVISKWFHFKAFHSCNTFCLHSCYVLDSRGLSSVFCHHQMEGKSCSVLRMPRQMRCSLNSPALTAALPQWCNSCDPTGGFCGQFLTRKFWKTAKIRRWECIFRLRGTEDWIPALPKGDLGEVAYQALNPSFFICSMEILIVLITQGLLWGLMSTNHGTRCMPSVV